MHIAEAYLPGAHCVAWAVVATPFVVHGARAAYKQIQEDPDSKLLLGAAGAFTFVLSALKIPSVTGSSSHPTGTGFGAVLFKPPVMALLGSIVLLFQALLLAHGGLSTLGANIMSMAVVGPWVGYGMWLAFRRMGVDVGVFMAALFASLSTYVVTATQLALAYHDGGFWNSWASFLALYAPTQLPIAVVEAIITVLIMRALTKTAVPELRRLEVVR